ncbi:MAG: hypothetical protein K0S32_3889 [Bacteroidetes bacterium]|jgi:hypothetical protein|nr:hypothetical protein [Bacteroidota bacterium]
MKRSIKVILTVSCIAAMLATGCRKKETTEVDNETQSAVDNAVADQEFAAIVPSTQNHAINTKGTGTSGKFMSGASMAPCDTLFWSNRGTADTNVVNGKYVNAPTYELNLANSCSASFTDQKTRVGKWKIRVTGPLKLAGSQMIIKLENHKASGITYSCDSIVVTTLASSTVAPIYTKFNIKLVNGVCTTSSWSIKYSYDRTFTHYPKGNGVGSNGTDPVTEVFGTSNGTNRQGRTFAVNTPQASPIIKHKSCEFIEKGILGLTPEGYKERTVDFGNGTCDDEATYTVNGTTVSFKLK